MKSKELENERSECKLIVSKFEEEKRKLLNNENNLTSQITFLRETIENIKNDKEKFITEEKKLCKQIEKYRNKVNYLKSKIKNESEYTNSSNNIDNNSNLEISDDNNNGIIIQLQSVCIYFNLLEK